MTDAVLVRLTEDAVKKHLVIVHQFEAEAIGSRWYFTGKPCKKGHVAERSIRDHMCAECNRINAAQWLKDKKNKDRKRSYDAARDQGENKERVARWRKDNPEKKLAGYHNRRARESSASGSHSGDDVLSLFKSQKGKCAHAWCRKSLKGRRYHLDHRMPLARGGSNDPKNLQLLCPACNLRKHAKHPVDFAQQNGMLL